METTTTPAADTSMNVPGATTGAQSGDYLLGKAPAPSLIVTSGASRSNYANNVNTLNAATSSLTPNPHDVIGYDPTKDPTSSAYKDPNAGNGNGNNGKTTTSSTNNNSGGSSNPDDGKVETSDGAMVDPSIKNVYESTLASTQQQVDNAKASLQSALSTLQNDPAATAAVNMIMAKYDQQIQAMQDKNKIVLGSYAKNSARTGMMQFANEMDTNFMSEEQDRASKRVTDLITTETQMVLKAQAAYKAGDVKAFDAASKALDETTKSKTDALNKLLVESDKAVKQKQDQVKIQATAQKQEITDNIRLSTSLGKTVADTIKNSGVTDPKKIRAYIEGMAEKSGITNPDMLESAVIKAQQDAAKLDLSQKNTQSIINKRNAGKSAKDTGGTDGGYKYTSNDITKYTSLLNEGGKSSNGTVFAPRGQNDGYVDPGAYTAAFNDWIHNNGTPKGFLKNFPVNNVNPEDYSKIPKALQPKPTKGSANPA